MTFKELQDDALDRLDYDPTVTTTTQGTPRYRIKAFINEWYKRILSAPGMARLRDGELNLSLVSGTNEYTLSALIERVRSITDQTRGYQLAQRSLDWYRSVDPMETASGNPTHFIFRSERKIILYPKPATTADLLAIDYVANTTALSADADVPVLPTDFHWLLSAGARVNEYERLDDTRGDSVRSDLEKGIRDLRFNLVNSSQTMRLPGRFVSERNNSRLGSWYPAE